MSIVSALGPSSQSLAARTLRVDSVGPALSVTVRLYIAAVCLAGVLVLVQWPAFALNDPLAFVIFLSLGGLAQFWPIPFNKHASVSLSMAIALAGMLVLGPICAIWVNLASGLVHYLTMVRPQKRPLYRSAVTTSTLVVAAWAAGQVFLFSGGLVGLSGDPYSSILPLILASLTYYLINTVLVTEAMALEQRGDFWTLLRANYQWLTVNISSLTPLGFGIALIYLKVGYVGLVLFLLPMAIAWYSFRMYAKSVADVHRVNAELKQANEHVRVVNDELKVANERLNIMSEVSRTMLGSLHVSETFDKIMSSIQLMGYPAGVVLGPLFAGRNTIGHWRASHAALARPALTLSTDTAPTSFALLLASLHRDSSLLVREPCVLEAAALGLPGAETGLPALLIAIPLFLAEKPWGIVGISSEQAPSESGMTELLIFRSMVESALDMALTHEVAERAALVDTLTGLYNHRYFQEAIQRELHEAALANNCLSFMMIDINQFKLFNDTYGHQVGDQVLKTITRLLHDSIRESDIACRYGGDELCVLLPQTEGFRAVKVAERIDRAVREHPFHARREVGANAGEMETLNLRVSIGVATFPDAATTRAGLVEHADRACYRAKAEGGGVKASGDGSTQAAERGIGSAS
jgi:diguanylate cyclase (GGDEF)-like protein